MRQTSGRTFNTFNSRRTSFMSPMSLQSGRRQDNSWTLQCAALVDFDAVASAGGLKSAYKQEGKTGRRYGAPETCDRFQSESRGLPSARAWPGSWNAVEMRIRRDWPIACTFERPRYTESQSPSSPWRLGHPRHRSARRRRRRRHFIGSILPVDELSAYCDASQKYVALTVWHTSATKRRIWEEVAKAMNFRFVAVEQTWHQPSWLQNLGGGQRVYQTKDWMNDLRQLLIDAQAEVEHSVIDDGIDKWRRRLHACLRAQDIFNIYSDTN